jgi:hypothetical protein
MLLTMDLFVLAINEYCVIEMKWKISREIASVFP